MNETLPACERDLVSRSRTEVIKIKISHTLSGLFAVIYNCWNIYITRRKGPRAGDTDLLQLPSRVSHAKGNGMGYYYSVILV